MIALAIVDKYSTDGIQLKRNHLKVTFFTLAFPRNVEDAGYINIQGDHSMVQGLIAMGYPEELSVNAVRETKGQSKRNLVTFELFLNLQRVACQIS